MSRGLSDAGVKNTYKKHLKFRKGPRMGCVLDRVRCNEEY